jgi:hypothetical protein
MDGLAFGGTRKRVHVGWYTTGEAGIVRSIMRIWSLHWNTKTANVSPSWARHRAQSNSSEVTGTAASSSASPISLPEFHLHSYHYTTPHTGTAATCHPWRADPPRCTAASLPPRSSDPSSCSATHKPSAATTSQRYPSSRYPSRSHTRASISEPALARRYSTRSHHRDCQSI